MSVNHWIVCDCCLFSFKFERTIIIMPCAVVLRWIVLVDYLKIKQNVVKICYWMSYFLVHIGSLVTLVIIGTEPNRTETEVSWFLVLKKKRTVLVFPEPDFPENWGTKPEVSRFGSKRTPRPTDGFNSAQWLAAEVSISVRYHYCGISRNTSIVGLKMRWHPDRHRLNWL